MLNYSAAIAEALQVCQAHTAKHKTEYCCILAPDERTVLEKSGYENYVEFNDYDMERIRQSGTDLVHSHPTDGTLSIPDLKFASKNFLAIWVITPSGLIARSRGFNTGSDRKLQRAGDWIATRQRKINCLLDHPDIIREDTNHGTYPLLDAWDHMERVRAAKEGIIEGYDFIIPEKMQDNCEKVRRIEREIVYSSSHYANLFNPVGDDWLYLEFDSQ